MTLKTRAYRPEDRGAGLELFDANMPRYFAPEERPDFDLFLGALSAEDGYLVLLHEGEIVACGGLERKGEDAVLMWGMVRRDLHRQGLGTTLLEARIAQARAMPGVRRLKLATSQHSAPFYARFGFLTTAEKHNGFGPGIDRIDMELAL